MTDSTECRVVEPIQIWRPEDGRTPLQELTGGTPDAWFAVVPNSDLPMWMEGRTTFHSVSRRQTTLVNADRIVRVWAFCEAPTEFKFSFGGDEDWVAHIPAAIAGEDFPWMDEGTAFGCCNVFDHEFVDGSVLRVGLHA